MSFAGRTFLDLGRVLTGAKVGDTWNQSDLCRGGSRICGKGGGAAATASAAGANAFGGSRLKTLFGISKGGAPPAPPPESACDVPLKLTATWYCSIQ